MSVFEDIRDLSDGKPQSPTWWRSQLFFGLQGRGQDGPLVGSAITFQYDAEFGEKMQKWDKYPMVYERVRIIFGDQMFIIYNLPLEG